MKPTKGWKDAHLKLRELYDARVPSGMSQEEFGDQFGIGTQGMVSQYLHGTRPLNFEAAAKFAKGLRCTIEDISPEMADELKANILPFVSGKAWRRAAVLAVLSLASGLFLTPHNSFASSTNSLKINALVYYVKFLRWLKYSAQIVTFALRNPDITISAM